MPWNETSPMKERIRLLADQRSGLYTVTELCERFGISRKTGYKWIDRFEEEGAAGLADHPRAPRTCPHRMEQEVRAWLLQARRRYPTWGPRKLLAWLSRSLLGLQALDGTDGDGARPVFEKAFRESGLPGRSTSCTRKPHGYPTSSPGVRPRLRVGAGEPGELRPPDPRLNE